MKNKLYIGIDHSVNKSATVAMDSLGRPIAWLLIKFTSVGKIIIQSNSEKIIKDNIDLKNIRLNDSKNHLEKAVVSSSAAKMFLDTFRDNYVFKIAIEDYSYFSFGKTHLIAENGGVFKHSLSEAIEAVNIKQVKLHSTGFGGADKDAMRTALLERYGDNFLTEKLIDNEDVIDAFFIADFCRVRETANSKEKQG